MGLFVLPDIPFSFLLALLPLFVVRSLIGAYQIRLFAEGQFRTLNASIVFSAVLFALVWIDANPASDLVQITAAMIVLLIVHINLQHLRDRTRSLPTLLSLGDWIRTLAAEPQPVRVGRITVPEWIHSRQKSDAVRVMRETFEDAGHLAFRSSSNLVFYQRITGDDAESHPHLTLQATTGGAANRAEILPTATENGLPLSNESSKRDGCSRSSMTCRGVRASSWQSFCLPSPTVSSWTCRRGRDAKPRAPCTTIWWWDCCRLP